MFVAKLIIVIVIITTTATHLLLLRACILSIGDYLAPSQSAVHHVVRARMIMLKRSNKALWQVVPTGSML
jgi:hypothetical protein